MKNSFTVCISKNNTTETIEKFSSCASYCKSCLEGTLCVYSLNKSEMVYCNLDVKIPDYNRTLGSYHSS